MDEAVEEVLTKLAAPFDQSEVKFRPGAVSGNRALALAYVDARVIQDRLDEVLGVLNWQTKHESLPDGSVICQLTIRMNGEWITKSDVGGQSEQPDGGDRVKAAFSDSLKRAAVNFGIGRYLYRLPAIWADFDPKKKQFVNKPQLPAAAQAKPAPKQPSPKTTQVKPTEGKQPDGSQAKEAAQPEAKEVVCIDREQGKEICRLLQEAKIVDGKGEADCTALFASYKIKRLGQIPVNEFAKIIRKIKQYDPSILPASRTI